MRKLQKTFLDFGEKKTGESRMVNTYLLHTKDNLWLTPLIFSKPRVTGLLPSFSLQSSLLVAFRTHLLSRFSISPPKHWLVYKLCWLKPWASPLTLVIIKNCQSYFVRPRRAFLQANPVTWSSKQFPSSDQITISIKSFSNQRSDHYYYYYCCISC